MTWNKFPSSHPWTLNLCLFYQDSGFSAFRLEEDPFLRVSSLLQATGSKFCFNLDRSSLFCFFPSQSPHCRKMNVQLFVTVLRDLRVFITRRPHFWCSSALFHLILNTFFSFPAVPSQLNTFLFHLWLLHGELANHLRNSHKTLLSTLKNSEQSVVVLVIDLMFSTRMKVLYWWILSF